MKRPKENNRQVYHKIKRYWRKKGGVKDTETGNTKNKDIANRRKKIIRARRWRKCKERLTNPYKECIAILAQNIGKQRTKKAEWTNSLKREF